MPELLSIFSANDFFLTSTESINKILEGTRIFHYLQMHAISFCIISRHHALFLRALVRAAFFAAAERFEALRFFAAVCACFESAL